MQPMHASISALMITQREEGCVQKLHVKSTAAPLVLCALTEPPHNLAWMMTNELFYLINKMLSRVSRGSNAYTCAFSRRA